MAEDESKLGQTEGLRVPDIKPNFKTARARLASLGLSLEDLFRYGLILDVGAKDCEIAKAVKAKGYDSVISVDRAFSEEIMASGMRVLKEDARSLSLENNKADLILVRSSAYYYTETEEETFALLSELNRVLREGGEQRIHPARFGHIIRALLTERPDFFNAKAKASERRSSTELAVIQSCDAIANVRTAEFLERHSIFAKRREGLEPNAQQNFREYLSIPKFHAR